MANDIQVMSLAVFGTVIDEVSLGADIISSLGLVNMAVVDGDHYAWITLDPNREHGNPEVVKVISHPMFGSTAQVLRGQKGTLPRVHPAGTGWDHAPIPDDYPLKGVAGGVAAVAKIYANGGVEAPTPAIGADVATKAYVDSGLAAGGQSYVHTQAVPAIQWDIVHNLGYFPGVNVVDSAGTEVEGEVSYIDANTVRVKFNAGFSGKAYLS
jgi:hypothetical protein